MPVLEKAETLTLEGRPDEANTLLLQTFPQETRTPIQSLILGNVLFKQDPKGAYELHRSAAAEMPDYANALLEWALDQHRAKEYEGAAQTFAAYSKLMPEYGPAYGLAAECRIRLGDTQGALDLWNQSEEAGNGTLVDFESLVCDVNGPANPEPKRAALLKQVEQGDARAAESLLILDSVWEFDWWNTLPNLSRLKHDFAVIKQKFAQPDAALKAAMCVAECKIESGKDEDSPADVAPILKKYGFLLDEAGTLPESGEALSQLIGTALESGAITHEEARARFGQKILDAAMKSNDVEMFDAAAHLYLGTEVLADIDQKAWDATHDARFAASLLTGLMSKDKLTIDDPLMAKAVKEFPEDACIAGLVLVLAQEANKPLEPYLVSAIKAEYTHLSALVNGYADAQRISARALRLYFGELAKVRQAEPAEKQVGAGTP